MFGLKEDHFSSDFHNGWRVDRHSDGQQGQLRFGTSPIAPVVLAVEVLQSSLEL